MPLTTEDDVDGGSAGGAGLDSQDVRAADVQADRPYARRHRQQFGPLGRSSASLQTRRKNLRRSP